MEHPMARPGVRSSFVAPVLRRFVTVDAPHVAGLLPDGRKVHAVKRTREVVLSSQARMSAGRRRLRLRLAR